MLLLVAIPVMILALMLQMAVMANLPLLGGTADLILVLVVAWASHENVTSAWVWALVAGLLVSMVSALPVPVAFINYLLVVALVRLLARKVWQVPILVMFIGIVLGTLLQHLISLAALFVVGNSLPFNESMSWITLPSILLNLIIALPVYAALTDLARWVHPVKETV